jgi:hypothetical protein
MNDEKRGLQQRVVERKIRWMNLRVDEQVREQDDFDSYSWSFVDVLFFSK